MNYFILNIIKIVTYKSLDVKTNSHKYCSGTEHYFIIYATELRKPFLPFTRLRILLMRFYNFTTRT